MPTQRQARWKGKVTEEGRECSKCGEFKEWGSFSPSQRGVMGRSSWCHECVERKRKDVGYSYSRENYPRTGPTEEQVEENRQNALKQHYHRRQLVFDHYGRACQECGETDETKLQLDHINDDGREHRERDILARNLTYWVVKNGFPEGFQILCRKCNMRKARRARNQQMKVGTHLGQCGFDQSIKTTGSELENGNSTNN